MPFIAETWDRFKLKRLMDKYDRTQKEVAEDLGLSIRYVSQFMRGKATFKNQYQLLTDYHALLKRKRIKEAIKHCNEMIKYYEYFD